MLRGAFGPHPARRLGFYNKCMFRSFLKSKIHRATVTDANLHYEGSVTIDRDLMDAVGLAPYEQVDVLNITNGSRLTTYAIVGRPGSGDICINGAAAHHVHVGDLVLIVSYGMVHEDEVPGYKPRIVVLDENNCIKQEQPAG